MGWPQQRQRPQQRLEKEEADRQRQPFQVVPLDYDYEAKVDARFSRYRRRERLRRVRTTASTISHGAEMDRQRRELAKLEDQNARLLLLGGLLTTAQQQQQQQQQPQQLLVNTPIPIINFRTNSDFPASKLPASQWTQMAQPPIQFEEAEYSECDRVITRVLVPCDTGDSNGDDEPTTVVLNGMNYMVHTVEDVVIPRGHHQHEQPLSIKRGYWLHAKLHDAIYGQVRYGTILHKLNSPIQVMLPSSQNSSSKEEWASVEWIATDDSVAVKEMSWEHIRTQRAELAEDPIKEVAAMQYLKKWVDDEEKEHVNMRVLQQMGFQQRGIIPVQQQQGEESQPEDDDDSTSQNSMQHQSHISMPLDLLSDDYNLYSITPFCTGGRLLDILENKNRFSEPEARYWMRQILKGLSCLKKAGVCHRDMSPENLMVHEGNIYIIDMGMCLRIPYINQHGDDDGGGGGGGSYTNNQQQQQQRSLILPQSACGKWYYLSPEVCQSEQPFDGPAVDLWAAGVILFIMLTGQPPWEEPKMTDENFKLMSTGYLVQILTERRVGLSADALDLMQRMFWLDPADRLSLEQVCAHPWMTHGDILPFNENSDRATATS